MGLSNALALSEISVLPLGPRGAARVGIVFDLLSSADLNPDSGDADAGDKASVGVRKPLSHSSGGEGSWGERPLTGDRPSSASGLIKLACLRTTGDTDRAGVASGVEGKAPNVDIGRGPADGMRRFTAG